MFLAYSSLLLKAVQKVPRFFNEDKSKKYNFYKSGTFKMK